MPYLCGGTVDAEAIVRVLAPHRYTCKTIADLPPPAELPSGGVEPSTGAEITMKKRRREKAGPDYAT